MHIGDLNIEKSPFLGLIDLSNLNPTQSQKYMEKLAKQAYRYGLCESKRVTFLAHWWDLDLMQKLSEGVEKSIVAIYRLHVMMGRDEYVDKGKEIIERLLSRECIVLLLPAYENNASSEEQNVALEFYRLQFPEIPVVKVVEPIGNFRFLRFG